MTSASYPVSVCLRKMRLQDWRSNTASLRWFLTALWWSEILLQAGRHWSTACVTWQIFTETTEQSFATSSSLRSVERRGLRSLRSWPKRSVSSGLSSKDSLRSITKESSVLIRTKVYPESICRMLISTGRVESLHRNSEERHFLCVVRYLKNASFTMVVQDVTRSMSM